ncbi:MAG TPA: hypothetical protein VE132_05325 [Micromonosporaceae bacterium]|nr:hypothetical protein [Micromonosporaceae bacterium]
MSHPARVHIRHGEPRWPASIATLAAIALYALLPNDLLVTPRYLIPALELVLVAFVVAENPFRMTRQTRYGRIASLAVLFLILVSNFIALVLLLHRLVSTGADQGASLLLAALQVWVTNVIVFALAYWQLDRGGPVARHHTDRQSLPAADFRFPQDEDQDTIDEVRKGSSAISGWMAVYVDYLYVSLTNSSAFSPTDTMPLTSRAKLLMGTQSTMALITSVVVIAKGVGSLK